MIFPDEALLSIIPMPQKAVGVGAVFRFRGNHMQDTINKLVSLDGRGILAADESNPTMQNRLDSVKIECTEENRHTYRRTLFSTEGLEKYINGIILFDETIRNCETIAPLLDTNIVLGIKVDKGAKPYDKIGGKLTEGLDGLPERLEEYKKLGAGFAKWRAVLRVSDTDQCIIANAWTLARYAKKCQAIGLIPIVEPEVLMNGNHHILEASYVTQKVLHHVFDALYYEDVSLEHMILKPNMVVTGYGSSRRASSSVVAKITIETFLRGVPAAVPMIAFLSGGQPNKEALTNLMMINEIDSPWYTSFSFGRALQSGALELWGQGKSFEAQGWLMDQARSCNNAVSKSGDI
jgi:fructose-bisphosphate aldolase class I